MFLRLAMSFLLGAHLSASQRGLHNVYDEIHFPSRPGFVFHDSRGFEAGSSEELRTLQEFVESRSSAARNIYEQLHAIWYRRCLSCPASCII